MWVYLPQRFLQNIVRPTDGQMLLELKDLDS